MLMNIGKIKHHCGDKQLSSLSCLTKQVKPKLGANEL
jgi:hypothetical protein